MDTTTLTEAQMNAEVDIRALEMLPADEPEGLLICAVTCLESCLLTCRITVILV
jgi:hypothetical protein